jgi:phage gp36-like protein
MTTPAPVIYASVSDLRLVLDGTDAGTGTAAQLTDAQLTLALTAATDRVQVYAGEVYDPSSGTMPGIISDLTLDLAAWYATTYYLKHKDMGANHPAVIRYTEAKSVLDDIRAGKINIDFSAGVPEASPRVINQIPNIFTGDDSNTAVDPASGTLYASTPPDMWGPLPALIEAGNWVEYQG